MPEVASQGIRTSYDDQGQGEPALLFMHGSDIPELSRYVREDMGSYGFDMWSRAGREIGFAYAKAGSPLQALSTLSPPVRVLPLSAQPDDPGHLAAQQAFSAAHPWFQVRKVRARSYFPLLEAPDEVATSIERFLA